MRIRLTVRQETRYDVASTANGAHARTAYSRPPSGPPSREAMCWRAWFWLKAVGSDPVFVGARGVEPNGS